MLLLLNLSTAEYNIQQMDINLLHHIRWDKMYLDTNAMGPFENASST